MEIKIVEEKKNRIVFESDQSHGFFNLQKEELNNDSKVKVATYFVKHPLISKPRMIVETSSGEPKKILAEAANKIRKKVEKFEKDFIKEVK